MNDHAAGGPLGDGTGIGGPWQRSPEGRYARRFTLTAAILLVVLTGTVLIWTWSRLSAADDRVALLEHASDAGLVPAAQAALLQSTQARDYAISKLTAEVENNGGAGPVAKILQGAADEANARYEVAVRALAEAKARAAPYIRGRDQAVVDQRNSQRWMWVGLGSSLMLAVVVVLAVMLVRGDKRRLFEERQDQGDETRRQETLAGLSEEDRFSLPRRWDENRYQLDRYHRIVTRYADRTRQLTLGALVLAFVYMLVLMSAAMFVRTTPEAIATAVIGTAGTAVGGFIAATFLRNSEVSAREVATFALHPIEDERLLWAEVLVSHLPEGDRAAALTAVIAALSQRSAGQPSAL